MKLPKQIQERVDEHDATRDLVRRLLSLLLEHGALDEYWFGPNQQRLRPDQILRNGRVYSAVELVHYLDAEGPVASPASAETLVLFVLAMLLEQRNLDPHLFPVQQDDLGPRSLLRNGHVNSVVVAALAREFEKHGIGS